MSLLSLQGVGLLSGKEAVGGNATQKPRHYDLYDILTYEEIDLFLLTIDDMMDLIAVRIMLYGGLRVGEVCDLVVSDLEFSECSVHVQDGKGGKERFSPLDVHTLSIIRCYVATNGLRVEDKLVPLTTRTIQRHVGEIAERAGIRRFNITPHTFRHTCATWQLDREIDIETVRANLGHEDIATTQIYLHLDIRKRVRSYREATRW